MIIFTTFFKWNKGKGHNHELKEADLHLNQAVAEKLIETGKMKFFYSTLAYDGPELKGRTDWDAVVTYEMADLDAVKAWISLPEHEDYDAMWKANNSIQDCFGFQLSDDPVLLAEVKKLLALEKETDRFSEEGKFNRS